MANTEPTILIKKKDGTTERVPLSSLQKGSEKKQTTNNTQGIKVEKQKIITKTQEDTNIQASIPKALVPNASENIVGEQSPTPRPKPPASALLKKKRSTSQANLPVAASPHELTNTTPVDDFFIGVAKARAWGKDDHRSLLEEPLPVDVHATSAAPLPQSRYEDVQRIAEAVPFSIPEVLYSRLHALIQSRIKDIRSDEQVRTYAMREETHGGLGLNASEAQAVVDTIHSVLAVKQAKEIPGPRKTVMHTPLPSPRRKNVGHDALSARVPYAMQSGQAKSTVSLQDIHPPKKASQAMGPVDEIRSMDLINFRRLSQDPNSAIEVLREKIDTIRKESYLEYIRTQDAWHQSPLYGMYLAHLRKALDSNQSLKDVLDSDMNQDDISVIASFTESLRF